MREVISQFTCTNLRNVDFCGDAEKCIIRCRDGHIAPIMPVSEGKLESSRFWHISRSQRVLTFFAGSMSQYSWELTVLTLRSNTSFTRPAWHPQQIGSISSKTFASRSRMANQL